MRRWCRIKGKWRLLRACKAHELIGQTRCLQHIFFNYHLDRPFSQLAFQGLFYFKSNENLIINKLSNYIVVSEYVLFFLQPSA